MHFKMGDFSIAYDDIGHGPEIIFIHGFPLCKAMWGPQTGTLVASGYRVITFDLPGFGDSDPMPISKMSDYAEVLLKLMNHLRIPKAIIAGMSMGGYVLQEFMARYPEKFEAALLIATRAQADDEAGKQKRSDLITAVKQGQKEKLVSAFESVLFSDDTPNKSPDLIQLVRNWMQHTSDQGLIDGLNAMKMRMERYHTLSGFAYPGWILHADGDKAIPLQYAREIEQTMGHCRLDVIQGAGHMVNMEKAKEFNHLLLKFLGEIFGL
ncbi:MAG: alpha/beta hydrolase [Acidobacteria bacterium]|nr:MAG: alpha/beta hydrolase [Acidobacteriota bacterium]